MGSFLVKSVRLVIVRSVFVILISNFEEINFAFFLNIFDGVNRTFKSKYFTENDRILKDFYCSLKKYSYFMLRF